MARNSLGGSEEHRIEERLAKLEGIGGLNQQAIATLQQRVGEGFGGVHARLDRMNGAIADSAIEIATLDTLKTTHDAMQLGQAQTWNSLKVFLSVGFGVLAAMQAAVSIVVVVVK